MAASLWDLDPAIAHLNHGSYGAVPRAVSAAQRRAARRIERSPERFYRETLASELAEVRATVAAFLGVEAGGVALVENATAGVQVALDAVALARGQEVVLTDHAYPWVRAAVERAAATAGARVVVVPLPPAWFAGLDPGALRGALLDAVGARTALVVLDQITSGSALVLPVAAVLEAIGGAVPTLVDGAHAPGLIDAPVPEGATFWVGNLHKWAFSARTAAALHVAPAWRERVRPAVVSAGAGLGYPQAFDYLGTQDPTAYLSLPTALAFPRQRLGLGFAELRAVNRALLHAGLSRLQEQLEARAAPDTGLPMRLVDVGARGDAAAATRVMASLRAAGVEVAVVAEGGRLRLRVSVQAYVAPTDFDRLADALPSALADA